MPILLDKPHFATGFINAAHQRFAGRPHPPEAHSAGVTTLINCLRKGWARRHGLIDDSGESDMFKLVTTVGSAYHALLPPPEAPREQHVRLDVPGVGQVTCYIDWVEPLNPEEMWEVSEQEDSMVPNLTRLDFTIPCELKTTRASAGKPPAPHYIEQVAGEVLMFGQGNIGRLYILYLAGNYKPPSPLMKVFEIEFTDEELRGWERELGRRLEIVIGDGMPGDMEHASWEKAYCPLKDTGMCCANKGRGEEGFFGNKVVTELDEMMVRIMGGEE